MTAFAASIVVLALMVGVVIAVGRRRPPGTPLTWGEALVAGVFVFGLLLVVYGVVPNSWLQFADKDLKWRSDKFGIPTGPLPFKHHVLFAKGISFQHRGKITISAQAVRDLVATILYVIGGLGQYYMWKWWQNRGKAAPAAPALPTSAYGRPMLKEA